MPPKGSEQRGRSYFRGEMPPIGRLDQPHRKTPRSDRDQEPWWFVKPGESMTDWFTRCADQQGRMSGVSQTGE